MPGVLVQPTEKEFQAAVTELAEICGYAVYHTHDSRRSAEGFPDLLLLRPGDEKSGKPGKLIFAELKSNKGNPTPAQEAWLVSLRTVPGIEAHLWRPADFDEIRRKLS